LRLQAGKSRVHLSSSVMKEVVVISRKGPGKTG
jgi:hypothetical protein